MTVAKVCLVLGSVVVGVVLGGWLVIELVSDSIVGVLARLFGGKQQ